MVVAGADGAVHQQTTGGREGDPVRIRRGRRGEGKGRGRLRKREAKASNRLGLRLADEDSEIPVSGSGRMAMDGWRERRVGGGEDQAGRGEVTLGLNSAVEVPRPQQTRQKKKQRNALATKGALGLGLFSLCYTFVGELEE